MKTKQIIVMRKDLNMRKGKMCSQASHASMGALLSLFRKFKNEYNGTLMSLEFCNDGILDNWLNGKFTKVCVSVDSEEELLKIYNSIPEEMSLCPRMLVTDAGLTEFGGVPTNTCIAIGPWEVEELDKLTGHLPLL